MATAQYLQKAMLDFALVGGTATPTAHFVALASAAPTSVSFGEATAAGYARQTGLFAPAGTPSSSGTTGNTAGCTFSFNASQVCSGIGIFDAVSGGHMLFYGNLSAASTCSSGDTLTFATSAITLILV